MMMVVKMNKYVRTIELKVIPPSNLLFSKTVVLSSKIPDYPTKEEIKKTIKILINKYQKRDDYYTSLKNDYFYLVRLHRKRIIRKTQKEKEYPSPYYIPNWFHIISKEELKTWGIN